MDEIRSKILSGIKRIVVKVGSRVLADADKGLDEEVFISLAEDISNIKKRGIQVVLVSSGAVAAGIKRLGLNERPRTIPQKQASAAVGQSNLMWTYERAFSSFSEKVAQILLTHDDLSSRERFINARNTVFTLLRYGIVPVINENDTVAVDEIKFGDNDYLSALIVNLVEADLLILLSHIDGLYDKDPHKFEDASFISLVERITPSIKKGVAGPSKPFGTGGMISKIDAAEKVSHYGIPIVIANGRIPGVLRAILEGKMVGTLFLPERRRLSSRKHWIAHAQRPAGKLIVDEGAKKAIIEKGKSLLPSGVAEIEGRFKAGETVICLTRDGIEFARGISNYSSIEMEKIKGVKTSDIEKRLGYKSYDEVIHRDNLVVI